MVDTKTPGDKKLSVPSKTLSLKPRVETGTVRQSFSHGRSKQVVVEKRGKRRLGDPEPQVAEVAKPAPAAPRPAAPSRPASPPPSRNSGSGPIKCTRTGKARAARIAPRISGSGALSEPTASSAMSMSISPFYLADSLVSRTARPLYAPHFAQAR